MARSSPAVESVHVGDTLDGELVHSSDPRFPSVMADIGRSFVTGMRRGVVTEAARAWLQVFVGHYPELAGSDNGTWLATRELTFPLFVLTLYSVEGGKSVGPSGFNVDLLRVFERGGETRQPKQQPAPRTGLRSFDQSFHRRPCRRLSQPLAAYRRKPAADKPARRRERTAR